MRSTGYLGPEHSDLDFVTLLYWLQLAMTHNVLLVYRVDGPLDANVPLTVIGSAIYEDITLMNHSCAANTTRFYQASSILQIISFICLKEIANLRMAKFLLYPREILPEVRKSACLTGSIITTCQKTRGWLP